VAFTALAWLANADASHAQSPQDLVNTVNDRDMHWHIMIAGRPG
jgi:hypothetical protein